MELGALSGTREQYSDIKAREVNEEEGEGVQVRAQCGTRGCSCLAACRGKAALTPRAPYDRPHANSCC